MSTQSTFGHVQAEHAVRYPVRILLWLKERRAIKDLDLSGLTPRFTTFPSSTIHTTPRTMMQAGDKTIDDIVNDNAGRLVDVMHGLGYYEMLDVPVDNNNTIKAQFERSVVLKTIERAYAARNNLILGKTVNQTVGYPHEFKNNENLRFRAYHPDDHGELFIFPIYASNFGERYFERQKIIQYPGVFRVVYTQKDDRIYLQGVIAHGPGSGSYTLCKQFDSRYNLKTKKLD
ncbi:Ribonuclease domain-containing protein [Rhizoctonia solani]|uniref:Ribonuclease domain-containing protein n=1 Tax=Rhizoctonia solani TaxID=456999 RepID=A0A8H8NW03_9AGAM|nr:Ribonuclease domain-containing protein [Rhizoctonia solani]QRW20405.1 Ribonuclease domain-containing protein [Rhizoctonia solani]